MAYVRHLIEMVGRVPVVALPAEIDGTSADVLRAALLMASRHGHATIVVDMTQTQLCDSTGPNMLVRAHKRAVAEGGEVRLVISETSMPDVLAVTGLDRLIPSFTSMDQALAAPAVTIRSQRPSRSTEVPPGSLAEAPRGPARRASLACLTDQLAASGPGGDRAGDRHAAAGIRNDPGHRGCERNPGLRDVASHRPAGWRDVKNRPDETPGRRSDRV